MVSDCRKQTEKRTKRKKKKQQRNQATHKKGYITKKSILSLAKHATDLACH
jgi:hypothetical protein